MENKPITEKQSVQPQGINKSLTIILLRGYGNMVEIERVDANETTDQWWESVKKDHLSYLKTSTSFNNYPASYFILSQEAQTPINFYAVKINSHIYIISFEVSKKL